MSAPGLLPWCIAYHPPPSTIQRHFTVYMHSYRASLTSKNAFELTAFQVRWEEFSWIEIGMDTNTNGARRRAKDSDSPVASPSESPKVCILNDLLN